MRLREIYIRCKKEYEEIVIYYNSLQEEYESYNFDNAISQISFDSKIKGFAKLVTDKIGNIPCFNNIIEEINNFDADNINPLEEKFQFATYLIGGINSIIELYESMGLPSEKNIGLDIKLPKTDNITDFKKYVDGLEFVFTKCPFFQSEEASLKFDSVDVGSVWLIIGIACTSLATGSIMMNNIAAFIDSSLIIKSHKLTCKRQEQEIRKAELEQKEKEELLKNVNKLYELAVKNVITELEESTGHKINDGDEMGRVEQSFERLEKMIDEGLQIYASIDSPKEVQAVFAPLEMHYLSIGEELKRIEEAAKAGTEQKS